MRKFTVLALGVVACSAIAYAADIPTRYSGSFPPGMFARNIQGSLNGNSLSLNYTVNRGTQFFKVAASYSCSRAGAQTRCAGSFRNLDTGNSGPERVTITWKGGQPVSTHFGKKK